MLKDLILDCRSYRSFNEEHPILREDLFAWADCARLSASSVNLQPLKYRLVYNADEVSCMFPLTKWAGLLPQLTLPPTGHHPTAYIVICHDTDISDNAARFDRDVGIAAHSIMLAACEAGYGGCMIGSFSADAVKEALSLSDNLIPQLVLALGKPDETVVLCEPKDGDVRYFRDDAGIHYVPKRPVVEVIF